MPKNTNRYRGAAEREARNRRVAVRTSGRFGLAGKRLGAIRAHVHRPHPRREVVIVGSLLLAVAVGLGSLGLGLYMSKADHDWASVATVNSRSVNREELRGRIAVLGLLGQERSQFIDAAASGGNLAAEQAPALQNAAAAVTSLEAARESLIDDDLLRQLASRDGIATPAKRGEHLQPIFPGKAEIEQQRVIRVGLEREFRRASVLHPVDRETILLHAFADALADHRIIFNK